MKKRIVAVSFILGMIGAGFVVAPHTSRAEESLSAEADYMDYKNRFWGGCKKKTDYICETGRPIIILQNGG